MATVAIAGSRALPEGHAPRILIRFLAALPHDSTVLLRCGAHTPPGHFEQQVASMCEIVGLEVDWRMPQLWRTEGFETAFIESIGRQLTFRRDQEMIADADLLLCFTTEEQIGDEQSGTANLVSKALDAETPVYAYVLTEGGDLRRTGEHDPKNEWVDKVPAVVG